MIANPYFKGENARKHHSRGKITFGSNPLKHKNERGLLPAPAIVPLDHLLKPRFVYECYRCPYCSRVFEGKGDMEKQLIDHFYEGHGRNVNN